MGIDGRGNRLPDHQREMREMRLEIRRLWQALSKLPPPPPVQKQMPFSWAGPVSGYRKSGPWYCEVGGTITGCTLGFQAAGYATIQLLQNDVPVKGYVIDGVRGGYQDRTPYKVGDRIQLEVFASGGEDLTAILTYATDIGW